MNGAVHGIAVGLRVKDAVTRSAAMALLTCAFAACEAAEPTTNPPRSTASPLSSVSAREAQLATVAAPASLPSQPQAADDATFESTATSKLAAGTSSVERQVVNTGPAIVSRSAPTGNQPQPEGARLVQGPPQTGEGFKAYLQVQSPIKQGGNANAHVVLEPQAPFKCNEQYPYRFYAIEGQGVSPSAPEVRTAQVDPKRTVVSVPITFERVGSATLSGTFAFSVCTEEKCLIEKAALSVAFEVVP